jgi:hypothetical protein
MDSEVSDWTGQEAILSYLCNDYCMHHAVAQLIEALRNNPQGRGFDSL